ncbi:MAG: hypothetical protein RMJ43_12210 [Chloroherpetonaceae bacterium]|nr:hypothetical protein [Chthonomonadaceae bacterium]MDW8208591.1 hypothetical protein [Chloroherpetonaceae bacterium]
MNSSSVPVNMISARSRRLRIVGAMLLLAALGMVAYGSLVLMPGLRRAVAAAPRHVERRLPGGRVERTPEVERWRRALATQILFAYGYWTFCGALVLTVVLVAYLDFREVSRNYLARRQAIWSDVTRRGRE